MEPLGEPMTGGSVIAGRYQITSLLGQGGMSRVYLATDLRLNVRVALKENLQAEAQARDQFRREAQILAHLSHPSLPRVMDHFDDAVTGRQYLVMDFVEGEDLNMMVKRVGRLPETTAVNWIQQILSAVEYLHSQQPPVIHRDIKPSNIKITPAGKAVLVDFGIAKTYEASGMTVTGARAATPGYAPPEQYGLRTDQRSDIYALGATLYTLLTGQVPPESTLRISNLAVVTPLRQVAPDISPQVEMATLTAMDVDTQRRWQSATQFRSALAAPAARPPIDTAVSTTPSAPRAQPEPGALRPGPSAPTPQNLQGYASSAADQLTYRASVSVERERRKRGIGVLVWVAALAALGIAVFLAVTLILPALAPQKTIIVITGTTAEPQPSPTSTATAVAQAPTNAAFLIDTPLQPTETTAPTETPMPTSAPAPVTDVPATVAPLPRATNAPPPARPTNTLAPTAIPSSPTPAGPSTVAVAGIRLDPADTRRRQDVTFYITFRNTFDMPQTRTWAVWVYEEDRPKTAFWRMEPAATVTLPVGESEWASSPTFKVTGAGDAVNFVAYVNYIAPDGGYTHVPDLNGGNSALAFTVNP